MKALLIVGLTCLLCACSSAPVMHTSINGYGYSPGPTSINDPRMLEPRFYMDEGDLPAWVRADRPGNR